MIENNCYLCVRKRKNKEPIKRNNYETSNIYIIDDVDDSC